MGRPEVGCPLRLVRGRQTRARSVPGWSAPPPAASNSTIVGENSGTGSVRHSLPAKRPPTAPSTPAAGSTATPLGPRSVSAQNRSAPSSPPAAWRSLKPPSLKPLASLPAATAGKGSGESSRMNQDSIWTASRGSTAPDSSALTQPLPPSSAAASSSEPPTASGSSQSRNIFRRPLQNACTTIARLFSGGVCRTQTASFQGFSHDTEKNLDRCMSFMYDLERRGTAAATLALPSQNTLTSSAAVPPPKTLTSIAALWARGFPNRGPFSFLFSPLVRFERH